MLLQSCRPIVGDQLSIEISPYTSKEVPVNSLENWHKYTVFLKIFKETTRETPLMLGSCLPLAQVEGFPSEKRALPSLVIVHANRSQISTTRPLFKLAIWLRTMDCCSLHRLLYMPLFHINSTYGLVINTYFPFLGTLSFLSISTPFLLSMVL